MDLKIKENVKENLFELIQNSYEIDVDYLMIPNEENFNLKSNDNDNNNNNYINDNNITKENNKILTIKNLLQKDKYWVCICSTSDNFSNDNNNYNIKCYYCERYRKIQTLDYFSNNPTDSLENLKQLVSLRRKDESKEFKRLLNQAQIFNNDRKQNINQIKEKENGNGKEKINERLYIIDINWFLNWKCYVMNDISEKTLSNNKKMIHFVKNLGKYFFFILKLN